MKRNAGAWYEHSYVPHVQIDAPEELAEEDAPQARIVMVFYRANDQVRWLLMATTLYYALRFDPDISQASYKQRNFLKQLLLQVTSKIRLPL